jgi:hypothetical protein
LKRSVDEMLCMLLADIFDPEVVDDEGKRDRASGVCEKTWSMFGRDVAVGGEVCLEAIVGKDACL